MGADVLALAGGLLLPLAFSPFDQPWLAPVALLSLFAAWRNATPGRALRRGYLFGLGQFGFGVSWVYVSMHDYGGADLFEAGGLTALFVLFLALYPALAGWLSARLFNGAGQILRCGLGFPAVWVLLEWFRGWFLTGFPWLQVGSSQVDTPLGQGLAPLLGVHGVSFAVALLAGWALLAFDRQPWRRRGAMLAMAGLLIACAGLARIQWTRPAGEPFLATLLQGNVPQDQKWLPENQRATLELYALLTRQHWDARLIVWPETAVPMFFQQAKNSLAILKDEAEQHHADLLIGIPVADPEGRRYYNAVVALGRESGMYFKRHLVPFGEFLPLRPLLGFVLDALDIPLSDFDRGQDGQEALHGAGYPLAASICYEDIFGHESRDGLPAAAYLVNLTNDAWFGDSIAPHQHVQMARMRALESGRYLLRATNTGVTAAISPRGAMISQGPLFQRAAVSAEIRPMQGATPYVIWGDWAVIGLLTSGCAAAFAWGRARQASR